MAAARNEQIGLKCCAGCPVERADPVLRAWVNGRPAVPDAGHNAETGRGIQAADYYRVKNSALCDSKYVKGAT